jgi:hypothetical protein
MEGSRKTPERTSVNDGDEEIYGDSPRKPLLPPVAGHNAKEVAERTMPMTLQAVSVEGMYERLGTTQKDMEKAFPSVSNYKNNVTEYLNLLSGIVHEYLG